MIENNEIKCSHVCTSNCRRAGCNCECGEFHEMQKDACEICGGSGEVETFSKDSDGRQYPMGMKPCICQEPEPDEEAYRNREASN